MHLTVNSPHKGYKQEEEDEQEEKLAEQTKPKHRQVLSYQQTKKS